MLLSFSVTACAVFLLHLLTFVGAEEPSAPLTIIQCTSEDFAFPLSPSDCKPINVGKEACSLLTRRCFCLHHIELKWTGGSCPASGDDGEAAYTEQGCQYGDYCGYTCKSGCVNDSLRRCRWEEGTCESNNVLNQVQSRDANVRSIAAGQGYFCALLKSGSVMCWGWNNWGQLGTGNRLDSDRPVMVRGITNAVGITPGGNHACALLKSGSVKCWGRGSGGRLGSGRNGDSNAPVSVRGISTAIAISAGHAHTCALLKSGSVKCWGRNAFGELARDSNTRQSSAPRTVKGISTAVSISAGRFFSCAVLSSGSVKCWGRNSHGQLGNGGKINSVKPVPVRGVSTATRIEAGYLHTCAVLRAGSIMCWGFNGYGQLGNGKTDGVYPTPALVVGLASAVDIAVGYGHTCATLRSGSVMCWGYNGHGELGNGKYDWSNTPVPVSGGISNAADIAATDYDTCVVRRGGKVMCWGTNEFGQLGNGNTGIDSNIPVYVSGF